MLKTKVFLTVETKWMAWKRNLWNYEKEHQVPFKKGIFIFISFEDHDVNIFLMNNRLMRDKAKNKIGLDPEGPNTQT